MSTPQVIDTVEVFLAHARALEQESLERYEELANMMEVHNNLECAKLFRKFAEYERDHAAAVERHAAGMTLPAINPWEYEWIDDEAPKSSDDSEVHYLMQPVHALRMALSNEQRGRDFYQLVAEQSPNAAVRALAEEFAAAEDSHVAMLQERMNRVNAPPRDWDEDPDPPTTPD